MADGFQIAQAYVDITARNMMGNVLSTAITQIRGVGAEADAVAEKSAATGLTGSKAFLAIGAAAAGVAVTVVKMAGDFQSSTERLITSAGESQTNIGMVRDGILAMAGAVGYSADELSAAMYKIESGGQHGAAGLQVLQAAAQGAKEENASLVTVADAVTSALQDYHLSASDAATVTSKLVAATSSGKMTFEELAGSMNSILPIASANHISLNDILGDLASMTVHGESAQQAAQNLANAVRSMSAPNAVASKELAALGINATDLSAKLGERGLSGTMQLVSQAILKNMGPDSTMTVTNLANALNGLPPSVQALGQQVLDGTITMKAFTAATKGMDPITAGQAKAFESLAISMHGIGSEALSGSQVYQSYTQALGKATGGATGLNVALMLTGENTGITTSAIKAVTGATAEADGSTRGWADIQGTFNQKVAEAKAGLGAFAIEIGTYFLPVVTAIAGALALGVTWLSKHKDAAIIAAAIVGGVLVAAFAALAVAAWTAMAPFIPFGLAIAGLIAVGVLLVAHWTGVKNAALAVWGAISGFLLGIWRGLADAVTEIFNGIGAVISDVWHFVADITTIVWDAITGYLNRMWNAHKNLVIPIYTAIRDFIVMIWSAVRDTSIAIWNVIAGFFAPALNAFRFLFQAAWDAIRFIFTSAWNAIRDTAISIWNGIAGFFAGAFGQFRGNFGGTWNAIVGDFSNIWGQVTGIAHRIWDDVVNIFRAGANAVIGFINGFVNGTDVVLKFLLIPAIPNIPGLATGGTVGSGFTTSGPMAIVGEGNPSHPEYVIPTDPAHRSNAIGLYQSLGAKLMAGGGIIDWIGSTVSKAEKWIGGDATGLMNSAVDGLTSGIGEPFKDLAAGIGHKAVAAIKALIDKAQAAAAAVSGGIGAPFLGAQGSAALNSWVTTALAMMGMPLSFLPGIENLIMHESGGNPNAINRTDSNAMAGHPSQGLMQTIPSTFAAYVLPALAAAGINDPVANITAGVRYAMANYGPGMLMAGGRHDASGNYLGYDAGGLLPAGLTLASNTSGAPERILNASQTARLDSLLSGTGRTGGVTVNVTQLAASAAETGRYVALALRTVA